ncbi:MAG: hypothetical protein J6K04_10160 [Lachnospiraceae bacterium]|nr:hypothetical protein [Lachnospiraceae bacterium]
MMKSFFKKLASVLALAMVVSLAAPAAQTAAAAEAKEFTYKYQTGIGADVKTVNLAKTGDTVDLKFIGIPDFKDYELQWMGYGTGFTVDAKTGVLTATENAGEGVVWLSVGDDQTYVSDPIKVTVGELKATIGTQDKSNKDLGEITLTEGDKMDLAFYGITDWNLGKYGYKWVVADTSILDVDQKTGEITALKAGETTVTFLAPNKFNQANVVVTNALKVTVKPAVEPGIVADQETQNMFYINFTDLVAANYDENDIEMVRIFPADKDTTGDGVIDARDAEGEDTFFIKPVSVDKDNNRLVVDTYADFVDGATYEVRIGEYKNRFVASVGEVASIELSATTGYVAAEGISAVPAELSVVLRDANGINVTTVEVKGIRNCDNIVYSIKGSTDDIYLNGNEVIFIEEGVVTAIASFDYYDRTEKLESNPCTVKGVRHSAYVAEVIAWDIVNLDDANDKVVWDDVVKNQTPLSLAVKDANRYVVALLKDSRGNYFTTHTRGTANKYAGKDVYLMDYIAPDLGDTFVFAANGYYVEFETLNPDNLLMYADGELVTYKETTSTIKLNLYNIYDENVKDEIAAVPVTVKPERKLTYVESSSKSISGVTDTVNNDFDAQLASPKVTIKVFDQYKDKWFGASNFDVDLVTDSAYKTAEKDALNAYADTLLTGVTIDEEFDIVFNTRTIREALRDSAGNYSNRNAVSFKITERNSGRFVTVTVKLLVPNFVTTEMDNTVKVDTNRANNMTIADNGPSWLVDVDQRAWNPDWDNRFFVERAANVTLYDTSNAYNVALSADELVVANHKVSALKAVDYPTVVPGTKMLIVTDKNNNIVPSTEVGGTNIARRTATGYATTSALGVKVVPGTSGSSSYFTYQVITAAKELDGPDADRMAYLTTGQYTVQVRTVKEIDNDGYIILYPQNSSKTSVVRTFRVTNTSPTLAYAGQITRDLRESADSVEEVVANAFKFNLVDNGSAKTWLSNKQSERDILQSLVYSVDRYVGDGYVYVKSVTFKVPVNSYDKDAIDNSYLDPSFGYYLITVPVNSSVKVSTDLFYFN